MLKQEQMAFFLHLTSLLVVCVTSPVMAFVKACQLPEISGCQFLFILLE